MSATAATIPALGPVLPELVLAIAALVLVLVGAFRGDAGKRLVDVIALAALFLAGFLVLDQGAATQVTFNGAFVSDAFARFMKILTLVGAIVALILSSSFLREEKINRFEYPILIVLSTLGMMVMISANELISLYLGLELQSLALYVLAAIHRDNAKATEAGLKYFVLGALSSGMLLYGMSLIYGFTGSVTFPTVAKALQGAHGAGVVFGLVFVMAGLAFKISAVPFHMWTPDVYEGAPTPVAAFFASAPKMAAVAIFVRLMVDAFPGITREWQPIVSFIAIASMGLGAFAAIGQSNIKRLIAYSSIGNMGYGLVGLAAGTVQGVEGIAIFMAIYLAMTLGAFACILAMKTEKGRVEDIADLSGLSRTSPMMAFMLAMILFSLIGIPPLAGFFGKFYVFAAAIQAKLYPLAVIGILTSVVAAFYYLRVIKVMYLDEPRAAFLPAAIEVRAVLGIAGLFILLFWIFPGPAMKDA
ncbi:MAG TPA: NADH-quinone oxidoreductase subunit NuoN, partial [Beijerinckiaceae bacterium]|nr:NADH-quinone oxidoreductase subunit NuoN [Beijerinckiaceae bacterium]